MTPAYGTALFIDPEPRCPGWHDVAATITWTPRNGGDAVIVSGEFLDANSPGGVIFMGDGIEEVLSALDLWHLVGNDCTYLCDLVTTQLGEHPNAVIHCPGGTARLELIPHVR
ncbi:hypothetical protein [Mycolicibacter arupensis]|jgi:hypothetical protein|uniref:hypothetical protein n=1 Tax=Mycolicibacter arupensis TaxID=342002 RepID=UPI00122C23EA|nr:hypothetical protein [Mycolicibacter arupensis]KAA1432697.1 hypothetical protein F0402_01570 [Mycolicibacter arupensis]